jgi:hypothetical protein
MFLEFSGHIRPGGTAFLRLSPREDNAELLKLKQAQGVGVLPDMQDEAVSAMESVLS